MTARRSCANCGHLFTGHHLGKCYRRYVYGNDGTFYFEECPCPTYHELASRAKKAKGVRQDDSRLA